MTLKPTLKTLFLGLALLSSTASADNAVQLQTLRQELEALTQRVEALEQALGQVEARQNAETAGQPTPQSPWDKLHIGMKYDEVEALLGKAVSKQKGGVELWFYSDRKKEGPFVKFVFKQLHSWRGPQNTTD